MSYETIFVPAVDEASFELSLKAALPIASELGRHIMAYHVTEHYPIIHVAEAYWHETSIKAYDAAVDALAQKLESQFYDFCRDNKVDHVELGEAATRKGVTASWQKIEGRIDAMGHQALQADLGIIALPEDSAGASWRHQLPETILSRSACPLLVAEESHLPTIPKTVMVGWNGSEEAKRALMFSEPFLRKADIVRIVSIDLENEEVPSAAEMAEYLKRKGINAKGENISGAGSGIAERLEATAKDIQADMLVMGAYTHSRWREFVLGGVTHSFLHAPQLPLFMAH